MGMSAHQSAKMKNNEWLTPPEILAALGNFDLDPCAPVIRPWDTAAHHYTVRDNGLNKPWHGRVWLNPPFGREAAKWLARLKAHGSGIALIPARTETRMFYDTVWGHSDGVLFLKGRPHFHYVDGRRAAFNSGAPIALVAYGRDNLHALQRSELGFVVVGPNAEAQPPPVAKRRVVGCSAMLGGERVKQYPLMQTERMCYVAADPKQPGAAWAGCVDDPRFAEDNAEEIASWIRHGATVLRVTPEIAREMIGKWEHPDSILDTPNAEAQRSRTK